MKNVNILVLLQDLHYIMGIEEILAYYSFNTIAYFALYAVILNITSNLTKDEIDYLDDFYYLERLSIKKTNTVLWLWS